MVTAILKKITVMLFLFILADSLLLAVEPIETLKLAWENEGAVQLYGRVSTQGIYGNRKVSSEIELYWFPPKKIRREFYSQNRLRLVLVADETSEWRYFPQRNLVVLSGTPAESKMTPTRWNLLRQNYTIKSAGKQKVLNRRVELIEITPKYGGNPSRKLWIDKNQPLVLRSEQYNCDTQLVLTSYFTDLKFDKKIDQSLFTIPTSARVLKRPPGLHHRYTIEDGEQHLQYSLKTTTYLPPGYIFDGGYLWQPRYQSETHAIQLRYTDGLNTISIFEHPLRWGKAGEEEKRGRWYQWFKGQKMRQYGSEQRRKMHDESIPETKEYESPFFSKQQGKIVRIIKGNIQCILIADLPQIELQKIAQGME
ncbi:MAG: sigma-E factor regulatory protein RseB domain-containing protein [bacterium]|nr:sigma-E factor regulatory protein RseB domain-containing protein [bacterium]